MSVLLSLFWPQTIGTAQISSPGVAEVLHEEIESPEGELANDEQQDGEAIIGFGSGPGESPYARIIGQFASERPAPAAGRSEEEDGSIGLANTVELTDGPVLYDGIIGDSRYGSTGDYDHYLVELSAGMMLSAQTDTTGIADPVDSVIRVYDAEGELVAINDDADGGAESAIDSALIFDVEDSGIYSIAVGGCCLPQVDPKRAGSGAGPGSTGEYQLILEVSESTSGSGSGEQRIVETEEDNGSIPLATPLELETPDSVSVESIVGDGPHAETTGDADFYALGDLEEGTSIVVEYESDLTDGEDLVILLWDYDGWLVDDNSYLFGESGDLVFETGVPWPGEFFLSVTACCEIPEDPFDEESMTGVGAAGTYRLTVSTATLAEPTEVARNVDFYLVDLDVGDVLSAGFAGAVETIEIYDPVGVLRMGSFENPAFAYPKTSPLRHQGTVGAEHVAGRSGTHAVAVSGNPGNYRGELRVTRASQEAQTIFLDFDGETLDRRLFSEFGGDFTVSPFESFLFRWDLGPQDRDAAIASIVETVEENFETIGGVATNTVILNSLDDADPGYVDGVTRIVVGGSIAESPVYTIGIAETIDPGNLDRDEVGLVLLDTVSEGPRSQSTLNEIERAPGTTMIDLVGVGIGNIVSHEIGHLIGLWHTDGDNKIASIMDGQVTMAQDVGTGPDLIFGTDDDIDVDFAIDEFDPYEIFYGFEDTVTRVRIGLGAFSPDEEILSPEPERTPPGKEDIGDELSEETEGQDAEGSETPSADEQSSEDDEQSADGEETPDEDDASEEAPRLPPRPFPGQ